jgi:RNA polymerase sigma-70 factor (ECF subfamily)
MSALQAVEAIEVSAAVASADAFGDLTTPYRRELLVHSYRMLGSIDDAEDAVQETLVRAWNARHTFTVASSFRAWLYRIATNVCLDAIDRRKRRRAGAGLFEVVPVPADLLDETEPGPEARYDAHESISLAFLTALQLLSPRQRAVLILRDVLSWRATEVAELLELSVPAANSTLHRARQALALGYRRGRATGASVGTPSLAEPRNLRALLERYVRAWETADIPGLVALLRDDAVVSMPPGLTVAGSAAIGRFLAESVFGHDLRIRLVRTDANADEAYLIYSGVSHEPVVRPYAVLVVDLDGATSKVARMAVFADRRLVDRFGPAPELAVQL